jgi:hypothetical protein
VDCSLKGRQILKKSANVQRKPQFEEMGTSKISDIFVGSLLQHRWLIGRDPARKDKVSSSAVTFRLPGITALFRSGSLET